ncbi:hypothetical protein [Candidatus Hodarchaeum mangrovi]
MKLEAYIQHILENPSEEVLFEAGKKIKGLTKKTDGVIAYEVKIFAKEVGSLASFASPKATIMQWSPDKIRDFINKKKMNLSKKSLQLEIDD